MKKFVPVLAVLMVFAVAASAADIEMKSVESSLIAKAGYDPEAKELAIQMNNSSDIYLYKDVPQSIFDNLLAAKSKGRFYVENIKGKFATERK